ncbi:hypothetical protein CANCADRAFT_57809 [Tortispora caseinolytica NRRL Y-17796]|uniref:Ca3427-like PBP 2 domain-containing protein n=1 Tax=Tortispora caseinolytica NRRL Y-17796 TaxID=767744 RepID=A0A1E4TAA0_9ASCO|nr:hypothetical protein CANCADRAFT_57809 [Tortispora caseinolytica NRRL Y-17796]
MKIGYIPEHFSTPLAFAVKYKWLNAELVPYPRGSGHLMEALQANEIDYAVGLTEAFIAGALQGKDWFKIIGTYVTSPLCWVVSTGGRRDVTMDSLANGATIGISRIGSGSHVMASVLKEQSKWPVDPTFKVLGTFEQLRNGVNDSSADIFMWERFTSKKYLDSGEIKEIGEIYTPWPSWVIVASKSVQESEYIPCLEAIDKGINYFDNNKDEAVAYIAENLDYSLEDATTWLGTVQFNTPTVKGIDKAVVEKTAKTLLNAGVVNTDTISPESVVYA